MNQPGCIRWARFLITVLALFYLTGLLGFLVLRDTYWSPSLALINSFNLFLYAPLIVIWPLALWSRSKTALLTWLVGLLVFVSAYGRQFVPPPLRETAASRDRLTVMTFNLGPDQSIPETVSAAIEDEDADIVAVQELVPETAAALRQRLSSRYPYLILNPRYNSTGLLSRYPILSSQWLQPVGRARPMLDVSLDVDGTVVEVLAVHLRQPNIAWYKHVIPFGLDDRGKEPEISYLRQRVLAFSHPVVVLGDFNMSDQMPAYAMMSQTLEDSFVEAGWGLGLTFPHDLHFRGFPVPGPLVRIDYVFHSEGLRAENARVTCKGGSDHCYVIAQLAFSSPSAAR